MKLLKIFAIVVSSHVLIGLMILPGCLSPSSKTPPATPMAETQPSAEPASSDTPVWSSQGSQSYPGGSSASSTLTPSPAEYGDPLTGPSPADRVRTAPSRPDNPDSFISFGDSAPAGAQPAAPPEPAGPTKYTVMSGDNPTKIAQRHGISAAELMRANPRVRADSLRPGDILTIPAGARRPGATTTAGAPKGPAMTSASATSTYTVKSGDSLSEIAVRNGTTVAALKRANNLRSEVIQIGQVLAIPAREGGAEAPSASNAAENADSSQMRVRIASGDTLDGLARKYGVSVQELKRVNNISDPRALRIGQMLVIPNYQGVGAGVAPSTGAPRPATNRAPQTQPAPAPVQPPEQPPVEQPPPSDFNSTPPDVPMVPVDEPTPTP